MDDVHRLQVGVDVERLGAGLTPSVARLLEAPKRHVRLAAERAAVMGIDWMTARDIAEAIPPAYTEYIGAFIRSVL